MSVGEQLTESRWMKLKQSGSGTGNLWIVKLTIY